jgi:hypothetical protein
VPLALDRCGGRAAPRQRRRKAAAGCVGFPDLAGQPALAYPEAVGKRFGGVDFDNGDDELAPAIALRRHAEG